MKARNFLFYTGYAESGSWACLAFKHTCGFNSVEEALQNFGKCIVAGIKSYSKYKYTRSRACCEIEKKERPDYKYCGKCGEQIKKDAVDSDVVEEWVRNFQVGDNNSIPYEFWEELDSNGWNFLSGVTFENVVTICSYSEIIIGRAAFGRIFDNKGEWPSSRGDIKGVIIAPNGVKVFNDE